MLTLLYINSLRVSIFLNSLTKFPSKYSLSVQNFYFHISYLRKLFCTATTTTKRKKKMRLYNKIRRTFNHIFQENFERKFARTVRKYYRSDMIHTLIYWIVYGDKIRPRNKAFPSRREKFSHSQPNDWYPS